MSRIHMPKWLCPWLALAALIIHLPEGLPAQELLTLEDAILTGLENNYGIRIAKNESEIASNNHSPGNAGFLPEVSLYGGYDFSLSDAEMKVISGTELDNNHASTHLLNGGLFLHWTLFDGTNMFINNELLSKLEDLGNNEMRISMENTVAGIIIAYVEIIQKQMLLGVLQDQVDLSRFRYEIATAKQSVGSGSEFETLQAQVDMNSDISLLQTYQASVLNARTALNELLARDLMIDFNVNDTIILGPVLILEQVLNDARSANSEILSQELNRDISSLELRSAKAALYPVIGFEAGYSYLRNETEATFIEFNRQFGPHLGVTLNFPIFDGFNKDREIKNAGITLENAEIQRDQLRQNIESQVIRIFREYESEAGLIQFEQMNLQLARKNMDIALESYRVGSISPVEMREVQRNLLSAHARLILALFRTKVKETELLLLSGKLIAAQ